MILLKSLRRFISPSLLVLALLAAAPAPAATWYVAASGTTTTAGSTDPRAGTSSLPYVTITDAFSSGKVQPGDTVSVGPGTYSNASLTVSTSGTASSWITLKGADGIRPRIQGRFNVNADYMIVSGFEVTDPSSDGIAIGNNSLPYHHHVTVTNNYVHDCGGGGIGSQECDYINIQNNVVANCSYNNNNETSGISLYENVNFDTAPGYHNTISGNITHGNENRVQNSGHMYTDGEGIIIDDSKGMQESHVAYTGTTLIQNNICYDNGGPGIFASQSDNVYILNNTCYHNCRNAVNTSPYFNGASGEITSALSNNVHVYNNITYGSGTGHYCLYNVNYSSGTAAVFDYNLTFNGGLYSNPSSSLGSHNPTSDPLFEDPANGLFRLASNSPAVNAGTASANQYAMTDFEGVTRPYGAGVDLGAFEWHGNVPDASTLWRIGLNDGSNIEFTSTAMNMPATYTVSSNWAAQTTWPEWRGGTSVNTPWSSAISYNLSTLPGNGVMFTCKPLAAARAVSELAVSSNANSCGIIEMVGAPGSRRFSRPYQVYIAPEFLHVGTNTLTISALGDPYNRSTTIYLGFSIDYMQLDALAAAPAEPLNGKVTYLGYNDGWTAINSGTIGAAQAEAEWMGVAYCGNPQRVAFSNTLTSVQADADRASYLQTLKGLDNRVILTGWTCVNTTDTMIANGQLPVDASTYTSNLLNAYGKLAQFYELNTEPCQQPTNASYLYTTALANYVLAKRPGNLLLTPSGYTFGGSYGDPVGWDGASYLADRTALDNLCDTYAGHSWADNTTSGTGSISSTIDAHGVGVNGITTVANGWQKPFVVTKCGSSDYSSDAATNCTPVTQYSSMLDRNIRAQIAFADYVCVGNLWNNNTHYDYISGTQSDPTTWQAPPAGSAVGDLDSRVKTLRRLALAYGTHGAPLTYTWHTAPAASSLVYFRGVNAAMLPWLPGSGAVSNKVLLSFVNFDTVNSNTVDVDVIMPWWGLYDIVRYGTATTYSAAHSTTSVYAKPAVRVTENLGPGESVEYIMTQHP